MGHGKRMEKEGSGMEEQEDFIMREYLDLFEKMYREVWKAFGPDISSEQHYKLAHALAVAPFLPIRRADIRRWKKGK